MAQQGWASRAEEEEPPRYGRWLPLALVALVALLGAGLAAYGWKLREERVAAARVEAERAAVESRRLDGEKRAKEKIAQARAILDASVATTLVSTPADLDAAMALFREAGRLDPHSADARAGLALAEGAKALLDGKAADAARRLADATAGDMETLARYFLGRALLRQGMGVEAWTQFDQTLKAEPGWPPARACRALAELTSGQEGKALDGLREAAERYPQRSEFPAAVGICLDSLGRNPAASLEWYKKAVALGSREPRVLDAYSSQRIQNGEARLLADELKPLVEAEPRHAALRVTIGRALAAAGDRAAAEDHFTQAMELAPKDVAPYLELAEMHLAAHEHEQVLAALDRAVFAAGDARVLSVRAYAELGLDRKDAARKDFASACAAGIASSCEEGCLLLDLFSCYGVRQDRVQAVIEEVTRTLRSADAERLRKLYHDNYSQRQAYYQNRSYDYQSFDRRQSSYRNSQTMTVSGRR